MYSPYIYELQPDCFIVQHTCIAYSLGASRYISAKSEKKDAL